MLARVEVDGIPVPPVVGGMGPLERVVVSASSRHPRLWQKRFARSTSETGNVTTSSFMSMVPTSGSSIGAWLPMSLLAMLTSVARVAVASSCRFD
jgi:hypothetical protein